MEMTQNTSPAEPMDDSIQIKDLLYLCLAKWKWFILSLLVTLSLAFLYLLKTPSVYTRSATLLIKENTKGQSLASDVESFGDLGLFQTTTNVNNELLVLQSPSIMLEVVKRLHLDMNYHIPGRFQDRVAYGASLPLTVSLPELTENESARFTLKVRPGGEVELSEFVHNGEEIPSEKVIKGNLTDTLTTPLGRVEITPTPYYDIDRGCQLKVSRTGLYGAVGSYSGNLTVALSDKKASAIELTFRDVSTQRAEDVLNTMISVYNENWVRDKNQIAVSTSMFINERLGVIERELGNVDENISTYKSENLLPDVQAASSLYMAQSSETNAQIMALSNQLYMTRYVRNYLSDENNRTQLLPANSGIESTNIESQISEYNTKLLQRNSLVANSSTQNPLVVDMDQALSEMRRAIITSIDNQILTLNTQIASLQQNEQKTTARIAANPSQAKYLLSVERQQKVKEALYLFLLQKREENELSQAFTAYNTRVITPPSGSMVPTTPVRRNILAVAFVIGLLIPVGVIFLREVMNTRIRGRKDVEKLPLPFLGEIPQWGGNGRSLFGKKKKREPAADSIVVREGKRDVINEAFRVLRTNLEFVVGKSEKSNVIILTSFNPGSGKSFLAMNIAMSLAIKGRRVLVIDGDLRHGSTSAYVGSPRHGLSDYLGFRTDKVEEILVCDKEYENLNILPVGTIPPNPTELLEESRFGELIARLRADYDYILIDCPPIEVVADTHIIEKVADRTLFVVRAGLLERSMLSVLENIYREKKFKNMALILNGTDGQSGYYGYGNRYGYHYGYGYHYDSGSKK